MSPHPTERRAASLPSIEALRVSRDMLSRIADGSRTAAALASDGRVPGAHMRRSLMPVISSSRPCGNRSRS